MTKIIKNSRIKKTAFIYAFDRQIVIEMDSNLTSTIFLSLQKQFYFS